MEYITIKQASEKWGISERRIRVLCNEKKIEGVTKKGRSYLIPVDAAKPADGRTLRGINIPEQYKSKFYHIDSLKQQLNQRRPLTGGELSRLREEFLVDFTYNSNAIEGNTLTLRETAMVLEGITIDKKPLKEHLEAVGHKDAFQYIEQLIAEKISFGIREIKEIHSFVLMDRPLDKGVYRQIPVTIAGAFHTPPEHFLIPEQMEQLMDRYKKEKLHPLHSTGLFHLLFEGIHPFIDGNGRTGRLIMNFMLMQAGYPPINIKFADRRRYYDSFDRYYEHQDESAMVAMIAEYTEERLQQYLQILEH